MWSCLLEPYQVEWFKKETWTWTDESSGSWFVKRCVWSKPVFYSEIEEEWKKTKRFGSAQKWGFERRGEGSFGIQSQEGQELTAAAAAAPLTAQKSSESHIVDVTNKSMVNRYLRVFHPVLHFMVYNRTSCWTCMSE